MELLSACFQFFTHLKGVFAVVVESKWSSMTMNHLAKKTKRSKYIVYVHTLKIWIRFAICQPNGIFSWEIVGIKKPPTSSSSILLGKSFSNIFSCITNTEILRQHFKFKCLCLCRTKIEFPCMPHVCIFMPLHCECGLSVHTSYV